jgi:hypothetical protein
MGAVLDKERVVREEDLSSYLTAENARNTYVVKPADDSYVLQKFADRTYLKIPSNDEYLLKSSANNLYQPRSNYVSLEDFNTYKSTADGLYQPKGNYATLQSDGRLILSNGINATTPGTQSNIANLNISNGFNAQNANSSFYAVTLGAGGVNSTGNVIAGQTKLGTWGTGAGNFSYFGNKNVTNTNQYGIIQLNNGDTYISGNNFVKIGPNNNQALTVDNNGNLCIGTACINSTQLATIKSKLGI